MTETDQAAPATTFLREYFRDTKGPLYLTVLRNGKSKLPKGELAKLLTRKPGDINKFLVDHDKPEQECGIYYCTATLKDGATSRAREHCLQFPSIFADVDDKNHELTRAAAFDALEAMESPPTLIVDSGHGLQPHWLLSEPCEDAARIIAARKKLHRLVASDEVHDAPRVMRLPGSHNSKEGDWIPAQVVSQHPERRYTLEALEGWLDTAPVAIPSKPKEKPKANGTSPAHGREFIASPAASGTDHKRGVAWAAKALEESCRELANTGEGSRHNILRAKSVRMGTMVARGWVDVAEVQRGLRSAAETCGLIKDEGIGEFEQTFADGIKHGMAMPHPDLPNDDHSGNGTGAPRPKKLVAAQDFPDVTSTGSIKATCANSRAAIGKLGIICKYDVFHDKLLIGGQPISQYAGELSDHACVYLRKIIDQKFEFDPKREAMHDACVQLCLENSFDPVVDYLDNTLQWDGVERAEKWLSTYLGAENTELNRAIGKIALVAMVRRARQPGCKFDQIIVLESPEGKEKSTALLVLAGGAENFSDQTILGKSDKDQQELLRGVWVYEIADLANIRKAEVEHVKAFASRTHDRARPAYGRCRVDLPRRGVIFATTNNSQYLKSQTGNRRFWPVRVAVTSPIDVASLTRDRDQLLAEAATLEAQGGSIVLPRELWAAAGEEQEQRREADPWEDKLRSVVGTVCGEEERVFSAELLSVKLAMPIERQKHGEDARLAVVMNRLGWKGPKTIRIDGDQNRGYWRAGGAG